MNKENVIKSLERLSEWLFQRSYYYDGYKTVDDAIALLKKQPEIIRCEDCRYYHGKNEGCGGMGVYPPSGDWFCADGKRRDDDD